MTSPDLSTSIAEIVARKHLPQATYRLQFNRQFTFSDASALVEYLRDLGISDCYASPLFKAGAESTHGYDVCGFDAFSPTLGTREAFNEFSDRLRAAGLGLMLDMVPNHMGNELSNRWWRDVLEHGPESNYAGYFDIDWEPPRADLRGKVLLPTLEDHYASVLESGKLQVQWSEGAFVIAYYDRLFPVAPRSYLRLIEEWFNSISEKDGDSGLKEWLVSVLGELKNAEPQRASSPALGERVRAFLRQGEGGLPGFHSSVEAFLDDFNGRPGEPRLFDRLHTLLQNQHYRLAYWKVGPAELNYRRFFDITSLVSLKMEAREVFEASHQFLFELVREGRVTGLRVDHPDGLWNPREYFQRVQESFLRMALGSSPETERLIRKWVEHHFPDPHQADEAPGDGSRAALPFYVVGEKILSEEELLPADWPVDGTTGYDFLNMLNGLFVRQQNELAFQRIYEEFSGAGVAFDDLVYTSKRRILEAALLSEWNGLAALLKAVAAESRYGIELTLEACRAALREVIATFPVYRTYLTDTSEQPTPVERTQVGRALEAARRRNPGEDPVAFDFIERLLLLRWPEDFSESARETARTFVMKFQQLTGPVTAKGLEDTTFYNFNRLISLNEVGGHPVEFGTSIAQFHTHNQIKAERWPHSMLATATHDTKRGEDARARIHVLSEMPKEWAEALTRWRGWNAPMKKEVNGAPAPHPNDEYLLYQTLIGAWPMESAIPGQEFRDRISNYMVKALKEAKARTQWVEPNAAYEQAVQEFVQAILSPDGSREFIEDFTRFHEQTSGFGKVNSLSQILLKMTSPGVPDLYQGCELWDLNLVDPDNRRPVDYKLRRRLLEEVRAEANGPMPRKGFWEEFDRDAIGRSKLELMYRILQFRAREPELFRHGSYEPLETGGASGAHLVSFARRQAGRMILVVAPRQVRTLLGGSLTPPVGEPVWTDTWCQLPREAPLRWKNVFTREVVQAPQGVPAPKLSVAEVLRTFPWALLEAA